MLCAGANPLCNYYIRFDKRPYHRAWEVWVIGFICLISGMGIGALLSRADVVKGCGMGCMDGSGSGKVEGVESAPFGMYCKPDFLQVLDLSVFTFCIFSVSSFLV